MGPPLRAGLGASGSDWKTDRRMENRRSEEVPEGLFAHIENSFRIGDLLDGRQYLCQGNK